MLHFMLTMLVEGPAFDIILNSGQGGGCESWSRLVLEYDPRSRVRAAGSMKLSMQRSQCTSAGREKPCMDDDVKVGCGLKNMTDESLRDHLVLQSKRLTTYAMVRAATGSSPMLVGALMTG